MMNINITITADTEGTFTAKEQNVLDALAGHTTQFHPVPGGVVAEKGPAPEATAAPEAKEEAPKPKRTRRTKAEIEAEKAAKEAAEAEQAEEDEEPKTLQEELAEDEPQEEDLRAKVVELAGKMVQEGNAAGVRSALQSVGAKKTSQVADKDLQALFDAMELNS